MKSSLGIVGGCFGSGRRLVCQRRRSAPWCVLSVAAFVMLCGIDSFAQNQIATYHTQTYAPGVDPALGNPIQVNVYQASAVLCDQIVIPPQATVTNPSTLQFDDPIRPGRACTSPIASTLLPALPNASGYRMTMTATDSLGQVSIKSAASNPFSAAGTASACTDRAQGRPVVVWIGDQRLDVVVCP